MISRVAENCFWLSRYIERAGTTARFVAVNRLVILDAHIYDSERWKPVVVVSGEQERFESLLGVAAYNDDEKAEEYLTWEQSNPSSIYCSFAGARENARTTREMISREMWESINTVWRWMNSAESRREYNQDRQQFYQRIRNACAAFQGDCHDTMLHDEPFDFMRFGTLLERANQTARIMDVKHHWLGEAHSNDVETPQESAQWMGLLRLCSAVEPFFKRHSVAPTGPLVVKFILQDPTFPRSVAHSLKRVCNFLTRINDESKDGRETKTLELARTTSETISSYDATSLSGSELHEELTRIIVSIEAVANQAAVDYLR
jgi:uncharacterized alpha-E superfamily protein